MPPSQNREGNQKKFHKIRVDNIPVDVDMNEIYKHFCNFGDCCVERLEMNSVTQLNRAIIQFKIQNCAQKAVKDMNGASVFGQNIVVQSVHKNFLGFKVKN